MLRPATSDDLTDIQSVLNRPDNLDKLEGYPDPVVAAAIAAGAVLIWEEAGAMAGFCWLSRSDRGDKIEEFGVKTPGGGIGARLMAEVIARHEPARGALWLAVAADNAGAIRFYERLGFVETARNRAVWARRKGPVADAVIMTHRAISPDPGAL